MQELKTPSGLYFKLWDDIKTGPIVVYLCGKDENINNSVFVTQWVPANKDKFTIAVPYFVAGKSGWEWPLENDYAGAHFVKYIKKTYPHDGRVFVTGWSAGGSYDVYQGLINHPDGSQITAFAAMAGSGDDYHGVVASAGKVPGRHYHGDKDGASAFTAPNNYKLGEKSATSWYGLHRLTDSELTTPPALWDGFYTIKGGYHDSAPKKAYSATSDLAAWFLSKGVSVPPVEPPVPVDDPVLKAYFRSSENKLIIETQSGKTLRFTPD